MLVAANRDGSLHPIVSTGEDGAVVLRTPLSYTKLNVLFRLSRSLSLTVSHPFSWRADD